MGTTGYLVGPNIRTAELKQELGKSFRSKQGRAYSFQRHYLDTLDWRLSKNNYYLKADMLDNGVHLRLFDIEKNTLITQMITDSLPSTVRELKGSRLGAVLLPLLDKYSLTSQLNIKVTTHPIYILQDDNALGGMINLEIERLPKNSRKPASRIVWYQGVTESAIDGVEVTHIMAESALLLPLPPNALSKTLEKLDILPLDNSSPSILDISPQQRCDDVVKSVFRSRHADLKKKISCIIKRQDRECLSDLAIVIGEFMAALDLLQLAIAKRWYQRGQRGFTRLAGLINDTQGFESVLGLLDKQRVALPYPLYESVEPLREYMQNRVDTTYDILTSHLKSKKLNSFILFLKEYCERPMDHRSPLPMARRDIKSVTDEAFKQEFSFLFKSAKKLNPDTPLSKLNAVFERCIKTIRLISVFNNLYPTQKLDALALPLASAIQAFNEYNLLRSYSLILKQASQNKATKSDAKQLKIVARDFREYIEDKQLSCKSNFRFSLEETFDYKYKYYADELFGK